MASVTGKDLNQENIMRKVFDNTADALKVTMAGGDGSVVISYLDDDIAIADRNSGNYLAINSDGSTNVKISGVTPVSGRLPVDVGSLSVTINNAQLEIANDVGNPIPISDAGGSVTVDSTNFGIRNLVFATDKVDVSNSVVALDAATLAALENTTVIVSNAVSLSSTTLAALENISIDNFPSNQNVTITNASLAVTGPITDAQLRASAVPVSVNNFPSIQVISATDLDIRDLGFATDKVDVSNSTVNLSASSLAALENITVSVDNFPVTQPVSGTVSLSSGTLTALENISIDNFPANQNVTITNASIAVTGTVSAVQSGTWNINNVSGVVSLPTGASTAANQNTSNTSLSNLETNQINGSQKTIVRGGAKGSTVAGDVTSTNIDVNRQALDVAIRQDLDLVFASDKVDVSGSTVNLSASSLAALEDINVTVSNEVEIKNDSGNPVPINAVSLPLPAGAATETTLSALNVKFNSLGQKTMANSAPVVISSDQSAIPSSQSGTWNINNISGTVSLPTGASTSAAQSTMNSTLSSIDTKTPALGQALAAVSVPVVLTAAQLSTLTPLSSITVTQATGTNLHTIVDSGSITVANASLAVTGTFFQATQPVSIAATVAVTGPLTDTQLRASAVPISATSLPLPTGAATSANQTAANSSLSSIDSKLPLGLTVKAASTAAVATDQALVVTISPNNPITATISNASIEIANDVGNPIPINGTVTANIGTTNGLALDSSVNSLLKPSSTLAAITTVGTITNPVTVNAGTNLNTSLLALDSTVAKDASLVTLNTSVNSLLKPTSTLAAVTAVGSITNTVVVKADTLVNQVNAFKVDGSAVTQPISASALPLPTNASTSALQTTGNSSLSSIDTKTPALGQALAVASVPVVLTAAQLSTLTPLSSVTVTQATGSNLHTVVDSGSITVSNASLAVTGTFFQATQPVSLATIPLATNASTDRTTAVSPFSNRLSDGTAFYDARQVRALTSADQVTIANASIAVTGPLTDVQLRASAVSVNGTVTANIGTTNGLALDVTQTNGTQKSIVRGGAKGVTTAADVTSTNVDANTQALDVSIKGTINSNSSKIALTGNAPGTATATTTSTTIVAANANRKGMVITNLTTTRVFLSFGANAAVANRGITLVNGGTYSMDEYTYSTEAIQAIVVTGSTTLSVQEFQ